MFHPKISIRREGWYYLLILAVVFGGALFKEVNLLLILAGMMLGPILLNWQWVGRNLRGLHIERRLPTNVCAGEMLSVGLNLSNTRRRLGTWAIAVEEQIRPLTDANHGSQRAFLPIRLRVLFPYIPAGQSRRGAYQGRLVERGRYQFGPLIASTRFPFGLFSCKTLLGPVETLTVLPRLGRLTETWAARRLDALAGTDLRRRRPGPEGDFYGVREWRIGDGRRLVHWRSSARIGKPVVRQFERPQNRDAAIVLDLWQPESPTAQQRDNVELAVSFAATVLADLCRKGGSNVFLALRNAEPECLGGPASPVQLQGMMEQLATVEARADDALPALLECALRRAGVGAEIILVGTRPADLSDPTRFGSFRLDPILGERLRGIRQIDASSEELVQFFQP